MAALGTIFASMTAAQIAGMAFGVGSTLFTIMGQISQGLAAKAAGENEAVLLRHKAAIAERSAEAKEQLAGQERAVSHRAAIEERRQGRLVSSEAQAIAAASGGGALDPTIINLLADVETETDFRAETALFEGEEAARGLEFGAAIDRAGGQGDLFAAQAAIRAGRAARNRSFLRATGTLFERGGESLFDRFATRKDKQRLSRSRGSSPFTEDFSFR